MFAALRGDVGNDACSYQEIYNNFNLQKRDLHFGRIEPVFALLNIVPNFFGLGHQSIFVIVAGLQSIIYLKIYQYVDSNTRWLLVFVVLMYYFPFHINTIRYGLAVILFSYSFILYINGKIKMSIVLAILSIGIHVAVAPLLLLMRSSAIKYIVTIVVALFLYNYFIDTGLVVSKFKYIDRLLEQNLVFNASIDWFIIRSVALFAIILWLVKDTYYKFLFLFFILGVGTLDAFIPVVGRFSEAYVFILLIFLSYIGITKRSKAAIFVLYPFLLLTVYADIAYPMIKGDKIIENARAAQMQYEISSGVRYSFYFEDNKLVCK